MSEGEVLCRGGGGGGGGVATAAPSATVTDAREGMRVVIC